MEVKVDAVERNKKVDIDFVEKIEIGLRERTGLDFKVEEIIFKQKEIILNIAVYDGISSDILHQVLEDIFDMKQLYVHSFAVVPKNNYALLSVIYKKGDQK